MSSDADDLHTAAGADALATDASRVQEFFLARQPILSRSQDLVAYELLFRRAASASADVVDDLAATAAVLEHTAALGLSNVVGNVLGFINVDSALLMSDVVHFIAPDKTVLEILETVVVTPELTARVAELAAAGYTFALDDVVREDDALSPLLPHVKIIKIDISGMASAQLATVSAAFKAAGKILLAEKVETIDEFEACLALGFTYFQGYYFARPKILMGKKLAPSQLTLVRLMGLIACDAETDTIEAVIKQDASIGLTLLRLVNAAGTGLTRRIDSVSQALLILGRRQLQRWLQILLYAEPGRDPQAMSPLLALAATRGRLLELIAEKINPGQRHVADMAFTVGMMSLMDTLFGQSMEAMLGQIAVSEEVSQALLSRTGFYGELLQLAEAVERIDVAGKRVMPTLSHLKISLPELNAMQLQAFEWSATLV